jgi:hypothetical protein
VAVRAREARVARLEVAIAHDGVLEVGEELVVEETGAHGIEQRGEAADRRGGAHAARAQDAARLASARARSSGSPRW